MRWLHAALLAAALAAPATPSAAAAELGRATPGPRPTVTATAAASPRPDPSPARASPAPSASPAAPTPPPPAALPLRVGDLIDVLVFGHDELASRGRIEADGDLALALGERVPAAGRLPAELEAAVAPVLARAARLTRVTVGVRVLQRAAGWVYFSGAVQRPSAVTLPETRSLTLSQGLAVVGGFIPGAEQGRVLILRRSAEGALLRVLEVDAVPLYAPRSAAELRRAVAEQDPVLADGDTVIVGTQRRIYILGEVRAPGVYWAPPGETLTCTRAVAMAGGFTEYAKRTSVRVLRQPLPRPEAESRGGEATSAATAPPPTPPGAAGAPGAAVPATAPPMEPLTVDIKDVLSGKAPDILIQPGDILYIPGGL